jgi:hypothetical protein
MKKLINVKFGFQNNHDISQCCGAIDCSHLPFDKPIGTNSVDWFDRYHN